MANLEKSSLTEALESAMGEFEGYREDFINALKQKLGEDSIGVTDFDVMILIKTLKLLLRVGAYVWDNAYADDDDDACSEILGEFQTDVDEIETLCNQRGESEEDEEQD